MENSNVAMFNDKGQVETLTQSQYNYDQRIAVMSADEKAKYLQKTEKRDRHDMTTVTSYGKELSSVISRNGDNLLNSVRGDNSSVVVQLTNELLSQLNLIDIDEINTNTRWKKFWRNFPIIGKMMTSVESIMTKYDTIKDSVTKIGEKIVGSVTDNEIVKNISSIIGAGVGASIGVDFVDSIFDDEQK